MNARLLFSTGVLSDLCLYIVMIRVRVYIRGTVQFNPVFLFFSIDIRRSDRLEESTCSLFPTSNDYFLPL